MRKYMTILCILCLALTVLPAAHAADSGADPLGWEELRGWASQLEALAATQELINDPTAPEFHTEDGYLYSYEFGNLYYSEPAESPLRVLKGAVVYDEEVIGLRGVHTDTPAAELLDAFYSENPDLSGTRDEALIYLSEAMPEGLWWGAVQRDGQWIDAVQYTVHEPVEEGLYCDAGVVFTLQQNTVVAARIYGLDNTVTPDEIEAERQELLALQTQSGYRQVPSSADGAANAPFDEDDLTVLDLDFLTCTPEIALAVLGEAEADESLADDGGRALRMLSFSGCTLAFTEGADGQWHLSQLTILDDSLEGPRALRVGDSLAQAMQRFRFDGQDDAVLYGSVEAGAWGQVEYGEDASATLHYGLTLADGRRVELRADFEQFYLSEINLSLIP